MQLQSANWLALANAAVLLFTSSLGSTLVPVVSHLKLSLSTFVLGGVILLATMLASYRLLRQGKLSPVHLYLAIYSLFCLLWPFPEHFTRFLVVVLPIFAWLWVSFLLERYQARVSPVILSVVIFVLAIFNFQAGYAAYPLPIGDRMVSNVKRPIWEEYQQFFTDMQYRVKPNEVVWSFYSSMYPLYVPRKVISRNVVNSPEIFKGKGRGESQKMIFDAVLGTLRKNHVTYVLLEPKFELMTMTQEHEARTKAFIDYFPDEFTLEYQSKTGLIQLYRLNN